MATSDERGRAWRISDIDTHGTPGYIADRLRNHAATRVAGGNGSPSATDWSEPRPTVSLDHGEWANQKWHVTTLPDTAGLRDDALIRVGW